MDEEEKSPQKEFELRERFVWKWHPHGWLIGILILLIIFLLIVLAR